MPVPPCPQCGAARDAEPADALTRCPSCGALFADGAGTGTLVACARFDPREARLKVARALSARGRAWLPGTPELVLLPFAATGDPRQPFQPLAALPPLLRGGWRPAGADLARDPRLGPVPGDPAGEVGPQAAVSCAVAAPALVVEYPLYRVPLEQGGSASAAWCDGVDGRVVLPPELAADGEPAGERRLGPWVALAAGIGLAGGLLLPFPLSAFAVSVGGAVLWWAAGRR